MAIYHCSAKVIGRSSGRSSVGASAYRAGEKLYNERDGLTHDYTKKTGVEHQEIMTPSNAPEWANDRQKLWNEVERIENRKDSQLAREVEIALPNELSKEGRIELVRDYAKENFVNKGMVADIAIHDKGDGNPHAHIMLTTRTIDQDGFGKKERDWNKKEYLEQWREDWSKHANKYLEREGHKERIDHRSYKDQGIEKVPTIHEGHVVRAMESRGIKTEIGDINRQSQEQNKILELIDKQISIHERSLENERTRINGTQNRDIGTERGNSESITNILFRGHGEKNPIDSSRTGDIDRTNQKEHGREQDRQTDINQEIRREREGESRTDNKIKRDIQGHETRNDRTQNNEPARNRKELQGDLRGQKEERGNSQRNDKANQRHGIHSKADTQPIMEGKGETIRNPITNNNRVTSGISRGIPTGEPFSEILKSLSNAIQKADNIEKAKAEQQQKVLQKQKEMEKTTPTRTRDYDMER